MGQCKNSKLLEKKFNNFDLDFYFTSGPPSKDWSINGGRYKVNGTVIGGNPNQPKHDKEIDL